jgi:hypothetical protein
MLKLKNHPFAVSSHFKRSLVLTYALPKSALAAYIPECLSVDSWQDTFAFLAVALVDTRNLRPAGFPEWMGSDFLLIGYRIFVRYRDAKQKNLRGLYILKSETDKRSMRFVGNCFTKYEYTKTDISFSSTPKGIQVHSNRSHLDIEVKRPTDKTLLPPGSPFKDWKEARRFAGPMPFTFSYTPETQEVLIIEGVRENWTPQPVEVLRHQVGFLTQNGFQDAVLASAFLVEDIPYKWKKGRMEQWKG